MNRNYIINKLGEADNRAKLIKPVQSTYDIINQIKEQHNANLPYARLIAHKFKGRTFYATCKNIFTFLKKNIEYKIESGDMQTTKTIQRLMQDGHGDCKHYANFINPILHALYGPNTFVYRFASYNDSLLPQHVYAVGISPENGREIYIDPVLPDFDVEKKYNHKIDKRMALYSLSGVNKATVTRKQNGPSATSFTKRGAQPGTTKLAKKPAAKSEMKQAIERGAPTVQPVVVQTSVPKATAVGPGITLTPSAAPAPTPAPLQTPEQQRMKERLERIKKVIPKIITQLESDKKMRDWVANAWGLDMVPVYKQLLKEWDDTEKRNKRLLAIANRYFQVVASEEEKRKDKGTFFDRVVDGVENTFNGAVDFAKDAVEVVWRGVKYWAGAVPRLAFTGLVRLNVFGLATKLNIQNKKNRNSVKAWWKRMGSVDFGTLEQAINLGAKEKAILAGTYIGVAIETEIAAATPVVVAAIDFLKASGVNVEDVEKAVQSSKDIQKGLQTAKEVNDAAQKFKEPANKAGDLYKSYQKWRSTQSPGQPGSGVEGNTWLEEWKRRKAQKGGISTNTLLLIGGAAAAAFFIFKKK